MRIAKPLIAVVGPGRMGTGISQVFAYAGYRVKLVDLKKRIPGEALAAMERARQQIDNNLQLLASLGVMEQETVGIITERVKYFAADEAEGALREASIVFEAVPEILEVKEQAFRYVSSFVNSETIIASTTSTFVVDTLAQFVSFPERFINTHWLNPAYLIPLVEVSPAKVTSTTVLGTMMDLLTAAGKVPVKCAPSPGFIVPRIQALAMNEAARLVEEGVAEPADIDKACRVGFGLRFAVLGLLEFIDWGGGDILYYADNYLKEALKADRFTAPEIINENMEQGKTGLNTGSGFYQYRNRDIQTYQKETLRKFVDLLQHMGLLTPPAIMPNSSNSDN